MQYSLPQFVEIEDKIIGPLTLKQFLILLFGGLFIFLYWSIFNMGIAFFVFALPTGAFFAALAFGKYNGRPILSNVYSFLHFFLTPRTRVFERTGEKPLIMVKKAPPKAAPEPLSPQIVTSRLRKLAYLLDQKTAEEERLIHSGELKQKWLNQI